MSFFFSLRLLNRSLYPWIENFSEPTLWLSTLVYRLCLLHHYTFMTDNVTNPWGGHPAPHTLIHSYALCKSILTVVRNIPEALCKCMRISSRIYCHRLPRPSSLNSTRSQKTERTKKEAWWGGGGVGWGGVSPKRHKINPRTETPHGEAWCRQRGAGGSDERGRSPSLLFLCLTSPWWIPTLTIQDEPVPPQHR